MIYRGFPFCCGNISPAREADLQVRRDALESVGLVADHLPLILLDEPFFEMHIECTMKLFACNIAVLFCSGKRKKSCAILDQAVALCQTRNWDFVTCYF